MSCEARGLRWTLLLVSLTVVALASSAGANHSVGLLQVVSTGPAGGNGSPNASFAGSSQDGTRVFFETFESLVSGDTDGSRDIYERSGSTTTLISTGPAGGNGAFLPSFRGASADGTRVFFVTSESLVSADTDSSQDVYERSGSTTTLISTGPAGGNGALEATFAGSSQDGTRVFFQTNESLVSGDTDGSSDVYQRSGGTTTRVSTGPAGGNGAFHASFEGTSADGTRVFFVTFESLVSADTDSSADIYERSGSTTTLISTGPAGGNGAFHAFFEGASQDGTRVFFETFESLVSADTDSSRDIYERSGSTTTLASTGPAGGNGAFGAFFRATSQDGVVVLFETDEKLVSADTDSSKDVYHRAGFTTGIRSTGPAGGNGAFDAFFVGASRNGLVVFFETSEALVSADTDGHQDIYQERQGSTTLVSTGPVGGNGAFHALFDGASQDGRRVFFDTDEKLVSADTDSSFDIYERTGGSTTLLSIGLTGGNGAFGAGYIGSSQDGSRVFFHTFESLVSGDTDGQQDVYAAREEGYPRPTGASPLRVPLVPAFKECTDPNRDYGGPFSDVNSCNPPVPTSDYLTVGTPDANGRPPKSVGFARFGVLVGDPATPADEANVKLEVSLTDVRNKYDLGDYAGELQVIPLLRITDKRSGPSLAESATVLELAFPFTAPCTATADTTIGGTCAASTTADAVVPGAIQEGKRAVIRVDEVQVFDGGPDGDVDTLANRTLFAEQGIFVP